MKIAILIEEGATASSVTTTLDMFRLARRFKPEGDFQPYLFSTRGGSIHLSDELIVKTRRLPADFTGYDAIILSGFFAESPAHIAAQLKTKWRTVITRLQNLPETTLVAASCYGTFVLAESGLLHEKSATTTWWFADAFRQSYPDVRLDADKTLVDSGHVITAGAMTAHTDLSLQVLRHLGGDDLTRRVSGIMLVDGARTSQRPFMTLQTDYSEPLIQRTIKWMTNNLAQTFSIDTLADEMHVSYRTLNRRFIEVTGLAPLAYLQALKIERAKELLQGTLSDFDLITAEVGYEDTSSFRRLFKRSTGISPAQYRRQFKNITLLGNKCQEKIEGLN